MRRLAVLIVALAIVGPAPALAQRAEIAAVRGAFDGYLAAGRAGDWGRAAGFIDSEYVRQLERVRRAALFEPKDELVLEPFWLLVMVLGLRHGASLAQIEAAQGRAILGLLSLSGTTSFAFDPATVTLERIAIARGGQRATAVLQIREHPESFPVGFAREQGAWRLRWKPLLERLVVIGEQMLGVTPRTPVAVRTTIVERDLFPAMAQLSGRAVSPDIWNPLRAGR
jgi:hypothetical protein